MFSSLTVLSSTSLLAGVAIGFSATEFVKKRRHLSLKPDDNLPIDPENKKVKVLQEASESSTETDDGDTNSSEEEQMTSEDPESSQNDEAENSSISVPDPTEVNEKHLVYEGGVHEQYQDNEANTNSEVPTTQNQSPDLIVIDDSQE